MMLQWVDSIFIFLYGCNQAHSEVYTYVVQTVSTICYTSTDECMVCMCAHAHTYTLYHTLYHITNFFTHCRRKAPVEQRNKRIAHTDGDNTKYGCEAYTLGVLAETVNSKNCCLHFDHVIGLKSTVNAVQYTQIWLS